MKKIFNYSWFLIIITVFILGIGTGSSFFAKSTPKDAILVPNISSYTAFTREIYNKIKENYWDSITDVQLLDFYKLAVAKFLSPDTSEIKNKESLLSYLDEQLKGKDEKTKKDMVVNISSAVLATLNPAGRSGLYTQKLETQLKNTVNNVNPEKDLYKDLGLPKNSSTEAVADAYKKQQDELKKQDTPEAKKQLETIAYANNVLTNKDQKQNYDTAGVEPTIFTKTVTQDIAYLRFSKFSPTSFDEFQKALNSLNVENGPTCLIFDLRGNIGGAIDATAYFLGLFLGNNQYAYDFYHKGEYKPFKTLTNKLPVIDKFHQIILLVDNQTQSSAELMSASLKRYNRAILVGVPTKGWGTVESVFPLENQIDPSEKYSVFLVHSITLRDDNQPIEGRGVEPNINITSPNWPDMLESFVRYPQLVESVKSIVSKNP